MININLLPEKIRSAELLRVSIGLAAAAVLMVAVGIGYVFFQKQAQLSEVKKQISVVQAEMDSGELKAMVQAVEEFAQQKKLLEDRQASIDKFRQSQVYWVSLLDLLPDVMPEQVWIQSLSLAGEEKGKKKIEIKARGLTQQDAARFYSNIEGLQGASEIKLGDWKAESVDGIWAVTMTFSFFFESVL
jgi:Tfp pilus assembly protein PilN